MRFYKIKDNLIKNNNKDYKIYKKDKSTWEHIRVFNPTEYISFAKNNQWHHIPSPNINLDAEIIYINDKEYKIKDYEISKEEFLKELERFVVRNKYIKEYLGIFRKMLISLKESQIDDFLEKVSKAYIKSLGGI